MSEKLEVANNLLRVVSLIRHSTNEIDAVVPRDGSETRIAVITQLVALCDCIDEIIGIVDGLLIGEESKNVEMLRSISEMRDGVSSMQDDVRRMQDDVSSLRRGKDLK